MFVDPYILLGIHTIVQQVAVQTSDGFPHISYLPPEDGNGFWNKFFGRIGTLRLYLNWAWVSLGTQLQEVVTHR